MPDTSINTGNRIFITPRLVAAWFVVAALLASGCAGPRGEWTLTKDHPAHPEAAEARYVAPTGLSADGITAPPAELQWKTVPTTPNAVHRVEEHAPAEQSPASEDNKPLYQCPMHPEVVQDEPGRCPKCKMMLREIQPARSDVHHQHQHPEAQQP